jgi:hypothetical protein
LTDRHYKKAGSISFTQRQRNERGRWAIGCDVSGRWLRFGGQFDPKFGEGNAAWLDVMTDSYNDSSEFDEAPCTRKLTSLMIRIDDLRAILEQYDEDSKFRLE